MLTQAISRIVVRPRAPSTRRRARLATIGDERAALARSVAAGNAEEASRLMYRLVRAEHDQLREESPDLLDTLIEWR